MCWGAVVLAHTTGPAAGALDITQCIPLELPRTITGCSEGTLQHCLDDRLDVPPLQDYHTAVEGALHGDGFVRLLMDQHAQEVAEQGAERAAQSAVRKLEIKVGHWDLRCITAPLLVFSFTAQGALLCPHWRCDI